MALFRFLHAADLHLDTPFHGIGRSSPEWRAILRDASLLAFDNLIATAISETVDFVLIAGDIYDGSHRGVRAQARFLAGLRKLHDAGIPSFSVHGNHDPVEGGWSALKDEDFPSSAVLFKGTESVESKPVIKNGRPIAVVHGISFRTSRETRNLASLFPKTPEKGMFHIGLLHSNVESRNGHGDYAPCSLEDLRCGGMDYWALGHIHKREILLEGAPAAVYPGNPQGRGFKETGPRGASIVNVDTDGSVQIRFVNLDVARFVQLVVPADGCETLEQIYALCEKGISNAISETGRRIIVRIVVSGSTRAHRDLLTADASGEILQTLRDRLDGDQILLASFSVETSAPVDRERLLNTPGFISELIRVCDESASDPATSVGFVENLRAPLLTGRFREFVPEISAEEAAVIIRKAEMRMLGLLEETES